nr:RNA-directed DNA polymerase, eukaryota [Tanacetum cinerariifolium]
LEQELLFLKRKKDPIGFRASPVKVRSEGSDDVGNGIGKSGDVPDGGVSDRAKQDSKGDDPTFPPGFTPNGIDDTEVENMADSINKHKGNSFSNKESSSSAKGGSNRSLKLKSGGSILDMMEGLVEVGQTMGFNMEGCLKDIEAIISTQGDFQDGECVILGDFNGVRSEHKRFGTNFNTSGANAFNQFISTAGLVNLPLEGYSFTWAHKSASKMTKLDRFLVIEGLLSIFPSLSAICLDRHLSDHRPILMRNLVVDYGPIPFRVFHSWFIKDGFEKLVEDSWKNSTFVEANNISLLKKKFKLLRRRLKIGVKLIRNVPIHLDTPFNFGFLN